MTSSPTVSREPTISAATRTSVVTDPYRPAGLTSAGLLTLLLGAALPMIDFFIVNVALPTIDATLHASTATLELVVAAYGIAYALLLVLGGRLGDSLGRRRLFILGLTAFTLTSLACGLAPTALVLVLARAAQGAASALMLPQVLATITATTSGQRRSAALGYYGATGGVCTVIGQLLGGVLVSANIAGTEWRPIFLVNVPVGIAGLLLAARTLPETRSASPMSIDRWGTALLGVALLSLLVPLMEGGTLGWPAWIIALLVLFRSPWRRSSPSSGAWSGPAGPRCCPRRCCDCPVCARVWRSPHRSSSRSAGSCSSTR